MKTNQLIQVDCLEWMREQPDTGPPLGVFR